jgi:hypothetical protein
MDACERLSKFTRLLVAKEETQAVFLGKLNKGVGIPAKTGLFCTSYKPQAPAKRKHEVEKRIAVFI